MAYGGLSQGEFTLLGDPVNLTFRMESLTRDVGHSVVTSGDFLRDWPEGRHFCKNLGTHLIKGRSQGTEILGSGNVPVRLNLSAHLYYFRNLPFRLDSRILRHEKMILVALNQDDREDLGFLDVSEGATDSYWSASRGFGRGIGRFVDDYLEGTAW